MKRRGEPHVCAAYSGDGATSSNGFHSGLNFAAVWKVPAVFVCVDNGWVEDIDHAGFMSGLLPSMVMLGRILTSWPWGMPEFRRYLPVALTTEKDVETYKRDMQIAALMHDVGKPRAWQRPDAW